VLDELREAAAPIDLKAIVDGPEGVYAQRMEFPATHHLVLLRLTPEAAAANEQGLKNLFGVAEKYAGGAVTVQAGKEGDATVTTLALPPGVPFRPTVIRIGDVFLFSSSEQLARQSLGMLLGGGGPSKFHDPRLAKALGRLPEPEDCLMFYDGRTQFNQLRQIGPFIRQKSGGDPTAARIADVVDTVIDEVAALDYEVTVEYTEGNQNRSAAYGKLVPNAQNKYIMRIFGSGQPFEDWQTWVPADALSYSLSTGINLLPVYEGLIEVLEHDFPETVPVLEELENVQSDLDVYLDRDILAAFSGEYVSVSLPAANPSPMGGSDSVLALRCHKPDRIRELLHRLVDWARQFSFVQAQQLRMAESSELEGFDEVSATLLTTFGARPVIGFRDGWMIVGTNAQAVQKVLDTRAGKGPSIIKTDTFRGFNLEAKGPVDSISYTNLAQQTRQTAQFLNQVGVFAPMVLGMVEREVGSEQIEVVREVLGLLPSVAQIVGKFDFLEAKMSVTQSGDEPGSYTTRSVTVVRAPSGG
jgi:hypothetical protein